MTQQFDYGAVEDRTMPGVAYGLFLCGFATAGLTTLAGLILAYASRGVAGPLMQSHYTWLIRTFWKGIAWTLVWGVLFAISIPLSFILIGIPMLILSKMMLGLGVVWYGVRCILGVVFLAQGQPYPRPYSWLI